MKLIRTFSTLLGAGLLTALTLALVLPAQEPAETPPPPPTETETAEAPVMPDAAAAEHDAAAPAVDEADDEMRELGTEITVVESTADLTEVAKAEVVVESIVEGIVEDVVEDIAANIEDEFDGDLDASEEEEREHDWRRETSGEIVRIGSDVVLEANRNTETLVAIMGNVLVEGEVGYEAIAVMGNNTVNGRVGGDMVAVAGNVVINGTVQGEVVAVMGNVRLGPEAVVEGEIICVGGTLKKAPGAVVKGPVQEVPFLGEEFVEGLQVWVQKCLLWARPLALDARLSALWVIMFSFLAAYVLLGLMMGGPVVRCAETMEKHPGMSLITALLTLILTPIVMVVLSVTVVGPPVLSLLLFFIGIFGKVVFLAWLGRRVTEPLGWKFPAVAVLIGGLILLAIYLVPLMGAFMVFFSDFLGTGIVIYTIVQLMQENRPAPPAPAAGAVPPPMSGGGVPAGGSVVSDAAAMPMGAGAAAGAVPPTGAATGSVPLQYSTLPRAGFWMRFAAGLLDFLVLGLAGAILGVESMFPLLATAYFIVMWGLKGTTVGGVVLGIKVVRLDDRPVDWPVAVVRSLGSFLSFIVMGLGFLWVAWDPQAQSWHDKIAGTTVVRVPKGVSLV